MVGKEGKCPQCMHVLKIPESILTQMPAACRPESTLSKKTFDLNEITPRFSLSSSRGMEVEASGGAETGMPAEDLQLETFEDQGDPVYDAIDELEPCSEEKEPFTDTQTEPQRVPCSACKQPIIRGASKCHHCGTVFHSGRGLGYYEDDSKLSVLNIICILFFPLPCLIVGLVRMKKGHGNGAKMAAWSGVTMAVFLALRLLLLVTAR